MPMIKSPTAWMLRQDGEAFPVIQHLYGSLECVEETLYAGEWLYKHTSIPTTQQLVLKLVAAYGKSLYPHGDVVDNLRQSIQEKPYIFLTLDFVEKMAAVFPGEIELPDDREAQPGIPPLPPGRAVQHRTGLPGYVLSRLQSCL